MIVWEIDEDDIIFEGCIDLYNPQAVCALLIGLSRSTAKRQIYLRIFRKF